MSVLSATGAPRAATETVATPTAYRWSGSMTKIYDGDIPFHPVTGEFQSYPQQVSVRRADVSEDAPFHRDNYERLGPDWRPNTTFRASMQFTGMTRGRSAARFCITEVESGVEYEMFMTEALALLKNLTMKGGVITGWWTFCKRGSNFGIRAIPRPNTQASIHATKA